MIIGPSDIIAGFKKCWFGLAGLIQLDYTGKANLADTNPVFSDTIYNLVLVQGVEQHFNIPVSATHVFISKTDNVTGSGTNSHPCNLFLKVGSDSNYATLPLVNNLTGNGNLINPTTLSFLPTDKNISCISDGNLIISFAFFK